MGKFYFSEEDAARAFQEKGLFNTLIVFNENNPSEKDFDAVTELFKVLDMANYFCWDEFGILELRPLRSSPFRNDYFLSFRLTLKKDYDGSVTWIVETNTQVLQLKPVIDLVAQKTQLMYDSFKRSNGNKALLFLSEKLAGILNRRLSLPFATLYGEWTATYIEGDPWPIISKAELEAPSYTIDFHGNNLCSFSGCRPNAIQTTGVYDSMYNVVLASYPETVLAFIVSLKDDTLTVVFRYSRDPYSGHLSERGDKLLVINYQRTSQLKRMLESV